MGRFSTKQINFMEGNIMAAKRSRPERIVLKREHILQLENELKVLENQEKEAERKARTKRLCRRGGFIESLLPDTVILSDDRFESFVKRHIANKYGTDMLNKLKTEQEKEDGATTIVESKQSTVAPKVNLPESSFIEKTDTYEG